MLDLHLEECKSILNWFKYLQMLLRLTYVDIPIGFELDLHLEECKSTLKVVQILTEIDYIDLCRHTK